MTRMSLAERRQKLIEAALAVIAREGVPAATTRAIAGEAGMPLASFHYAFESHQVLLAEATRILMGRELERLEAMELQGEGQEELLRDLLSHHVAAVEQDPTYFQSLAELMQHACRVDGQREVVVRWRRDREDLLARRFAEVLAAPQDQAMRLSRAALAMTDGLTSAMLVTGDAAAAEQAVDSWLAA